MSKPLVRRLKDTAPDLEKVLAHGGLAVDSELLFAAAEIRRESMRVVMRDGIRLATDVYLPPRLPAPAIATRTPYGRAAPRFVSAFMAFAQRGYVVISQDCRGTGDSEPDVWDYCIYEVEDGKDFVDWVVRQDFFDGFLASFGGSYVAMTQWGMATHPRMSTIAPEVSGLRVTRSTVRQYMFVNAYPRVIGKGANRMPVSYHEVERLIEAETMSGGYFNEPLCAALPEPVLERYPELRDLSLVEAKRRLWSHFCELSSAQKAALLKTLLGISEFSYVDYWALPSVFDCLITYGVHTIPSRNATELCRSCHAPALIITGWYDWNLGDTLSSWVTFRSEAQSDVSSRSRLLITPAAHGAPGYQEGQAENPELRHDHRGNVALLLRWYESIRAGTTGAWPRVTYYLMGANEWRTATDWPIPEAREMSLYLAADGGLDVEPPSRPAPPDRYIYDPDDPTPTVGGSILSFLYPAGSVEVSEVQRRADVLTYTTAPLTEDLDVVGPLRLILYASSSAVDTDFAARLSDVFPDGRAIQLQTGMLRARYRHLTGAPELLEPHRVYRLEVDMWATANRFKAGHRLRLDIASADFPRFDRNANLGGESGDPVPAHQAIFHDPDHPSHLVLAVLGTWAHGKLGRP
jgi:uncharacterized protein